MPDNEEHNLDARICKLLFLTGQLMGMLDREDIRDHLVAMGFDPCDRVQLVTALRKLANVFYVG